LAGYRFRRQYPIDAFIVDFACTRHRLVIEADGVQHVDIPADERRTAFLKEQGWRILRFWNNDILTNTDGVVQTILLTLNERPTLTRSQAAPATTLSRNAGEGYRGSGGDA
jgi:very-short-patch-repair endonuclease